MKQILSIWGLSSRFQMLHILYNLHNMAEKCRSESVMTDFMRFFSQNFNIFYCFNKNNARTKKSFVLFLQIINIGLQF